MKIAYSMFRQINLVEDKKKQVLLSSRRTCYPKAKEKKIFNFFFKKN